MTSPGTNKATIFFFIGPEKTGTTTIFEMLPFARPPRQKEAYNLSRKQDLHAEVLRVKLQADEQPQVFIVEPTYFISNFALTAIADLQEQFHIHVVHTRRDPLSRTLSHYLHHKLKGRVSNPADAVHKYPEIIQASAYDRYSAKWRDRIRNFHIIEIEGHDLRRTLDAIGIIGLEVETPHANTQLAPRSMLLSRVSTLAWEAMIVLRFNTLVSDEVKKYLKRKIYYGGKRTIVSDQERDYLAKCLSTTF